MEVAIEDLQKQREHSFDYRNLLYVIASLFFSAFLDLGAFFITNALSNAHFWRHVGVFFGLALLAGGALVFLSMGIRKHKKAYAYERLNRWISAVAVGSLFFGVGVLALALKIRWSFVFLEGEGLTYLLCLFPCGILGTLLPYLLMPGSKEYPTSVTTNSFARVINNGLPYFLVAYFVLIALAWIRHPLDSLFDRLNNGSFATIYRAATASLFVIYMLLIVIANRKLPSVANGIVFLAVMGYLAVLSFFVPREVTLTELANPQNTILYSITLKESLIYYLRECYIVFYAYCLLFVIPMAGKPKHGKNLFCYAFIIFCFLGIVYSFFQNKEAYRYFLSGSSAEDKYTYQINGFFESKNGFGTALFGGFICSLVLMADKKRFWKAFWLLVSLVLAVFTLVVRCDTAFVSCIATYVFLLYYVGIHNFKKNKVAFGILLALETVCIIGIVFCCFTPAIYEKVRLFGLVNYDIQKALVGGRFWIWEDYGKSLSLVQVLLGDGRLGHYISYYNYCGSLFFFPFHNIYLDSQNSGGLVLAVFYIFLIAISFRHLRALKLNNPAVYGAIIACTLGFLVFGFAEALGPLIDSSLLSLVPSFVLVLGPTFYFQTKADGLNDFSI